MRDFPFPRTWQQQDLHVLFPMGVLGLAAESEAGAEPLAEAQGAISPGPGGAGGDLKGGVTEVPLQQPLAQLPVQGGGWSGVPRTKGASHLSGMAPEMLSDSPGSRGC